MRGSPGRWLCTGLGASVGFYVSLAWLGALDRAYPVSPTLSGREAVGLALALALAGGVLGWQMGLYWVRLAAGAVRGLEQRVARVPAVDVLAGGLGSLLGLVMAFFLAASLARIPWVGRFLPAVVSLALGWLGGAVFIRRREEWLRLIQGRGHVAARAAPLDQSAVAGHGEMPHGRPKVLDTSAIIDGRVAELYRTGFLEGQFIVSTAVLDELRHIADSSDAVRRQRGRHGLDVLSALRRELGAPVVITDRDPAPDLEVDNRLVLLAKELGAQVVTTDYNLNKVAELQGVPVLNVNELAGVVRAQYLPGEQLSVRIVADGKQPAQGVGYLVDGTMVVVEGGRRFLNEDVSVEVTSSYQTAQGRMVFGKARSGVGQT